MTGDGPAPRAPRVALIVEHDFDEGQVQQVCEALLRGITHGDVAAVVRVLPVKVRGVGDVFVVEDDLLPSNGLDILDRLSSTSEVPGEGRRLSDAELAALKARVGAKKD